MHRKNRIHFKKAGPQHLKLLEYWDQQEHVINSDPNDHWNWQEELQREIFWRQQLIAFDQENPIGFVQIIDPQKEESNYWGEIDKGYRAIDIWIGLKENLNKGYGSEMLKLAICDCFLNPEVHTILIDPLASNKKAHSFYEKHGFEFLEERNFGDDECFVYFLRKVIYITIYLFKSDI